MAALEDVFAKTMPAEMGFDYKDMSSRSSKPKRECHPP